MQHLSYMRCYAAGSAGACRHHRALWGVRTRNPAYSVMAVEDLKGCEAKLQVPSRLTVGGSRQTEVPRHGAPGGTGSSSPRHHRSQHSGVGRTCIPALPTVGAAAPPSASPASACMPPGTGALPPVRVAPSRWGNLNWEKLSLGLHPAPIRLLSGTEQAQNRFQVPPALSQPFLDRAQLGPWTQA